MIGYLEGKFVEVTPYKTYIDINGLGYEVNITLPTYEKIKDLKTGKLFTYLQVREDAWVLYGFFAMAEKELFIQLLSVSGVGAATARVILSSLSYAELSRIIANGDNKALEKVKGIGTKTAQRIILELRGKIVLDEIAQADANNVNVQHTNNNDALNALVSLGIAKTMAENALKKVLKAEGEDLAVEDLIKLALKNL